jgi:hypothetical protein
LSRLGEGATRGSASVSVRRFAISILMQAEDSVDAALYASRQGKAERGQRQPRIAAEKETIAMARKKANQWYIVTQEYTVQRKYLVPATSAREARSLDLPHAGYEGDNEDDWYDSLLGAIDEDPRPRTVRAVGFPTKDEAMESDEAWVEWSN